MSPHEAGRTLPLCTCQAPVGGHGGYRTGSGRKNLLEKHECKKILKLHYQGVRTRDIAARFGISADLAQTTIRRMKDAE